MLAHAQNLQPLFGGCLSVFPDGAVGMTAGQRMRVQIGNQFQHGVSPFYPAVIVRSSSLKLPDQKA